MNKLVLAVAVIACTLHSTAHAGTITSVTAFSLPGFSTGSIGPVGVTPAPNNDNTAVASANLVPAMVFFNTLGTAEFEFAVSDSGGTTEYRFTHPLINNTGVPWLGFTYELGFGTGAAFTPSTLGDDLDFDAPTFDPAPTSSAFSTLAAQADMLAWSGGTVNSIGSVFATFAIDVPDNLSAFNPARLDRFTLRLIPVVTPTVTEPPVMLLAALGLALLAMSRGMRRAARAA
jgi:hypothetical protein